MSFERKSVKKDKIIKNRVFKYVFGFAYIFLPLWSCFAGQRQPDKLHNKKDRDLLCTGLCKEKYAVTA